MTICEINWKSAKNTQKIYLFSKAKPLSLTHLLQFVQTACLPNEPFKCNSYHTLMVEQMHKIILRN